MGFAPSVLIAADTSHDPTPADLSAVVRVLDTMVASAEPAVVFTSAVRLCVPLVGHFAKVEMSGPEQQPYAITWPRKPTGRPYPTPTSTVRTSIIGEPTEAHLGYRGTLTLHSYSPLTQVHAVLAQLVVDRATALVHRERLTDLVYDATARAAQLDVALASNREIGVAIGILMSLRKMTRGHALEMLREISQRTNRKLHDIALDVIDTGTIEPLTDVTPPASGRATHLSSYRSTRRTVTDCAS